MSEFGLDEELKIDSAESQNAIEVVEKPKRRPWYEWEVGGQSYKLKLHSGIICKLEEKYRTNLLNVISGDGIAPLGVMLTILQGAMTKYQHGITYSKIQQIYDRYTEEGGNQLSLYADVLLGTMAASGFFTETQAEELATQMKAAEQMM